MKAEDYLIEWMEFRIFLVYLRQYFEYWAMRCLKEWINRETIKLFWKKYRKINSIKYRPYIF
jgi:hypothetical protein